jgi:hypothetical protein
MLVTKKEAKVGTAAVHTVKKSGTLLYRIERYYEEDPERPKGMRRTRERLRTLTEDVERDGFQTVVLDTVTAFEMQGRFQSQFVDKAGSSEPRQWFADSTDWVERMVMVRMPSLVTKLGVYGMVIAHTSSDRDKDGNILKYTPDMPGRCATRPGSFYNEIYYVDKNTEGEALFFVSDKNYTATTGIELPNGCPAQWSAVKAALDKLGMPELHFCWMLHGRYGAGKSTAAATWPTPTLVLLFDSPGKDLPYLKRGATRKEVKGPGGLPTIEVYS